MTASSKLIIRRQGLIAKKIGRDFVVLDTKESKLYFLNQTAEIIYQFVDNVKTLDQVVKKLDQTYKAKKETIRNDLEEFLAINKTLFKIK